jgi:phosphohistidine swiveling domain-containing protein
MYNDYAHVRDLPVERFLERIRELIMKPRTRRELLTLNKRLESVARKQRQLIATLRLSKNQRRVLTLLQTIQVWRDQRKAMNQLGSATLLRFASELRRRSRLPKTLVLQAFWLEFDKLLDPTLSFRRQLRSRNQAALHLTLRPKVLPGTVGQPARRLHRFVDRLIQRGELRGRPAYPGVVRGIARVMLRQRDFPRFKRGEVLVAANTRPEYVPIMKRAAAIVTEEGGITSHAAIVSRELKIPAVVGVQGILDVINDGDRVEVDATNGTVRKL